ncbi:vanadium-dependent haloperoxidase [Streptomyces sp. NPDC048172]|uniref:vanadium-dependent haloperoxidase n=1 Tax=Streptomyces sp. NPDC048172 TaxID=3365505 RepID=UPI003712C00A
MTSAGYAAAEGPEEKGAESVSKGADFDFEKGNAPLELIYPKVQAAVREDVSPKANDATLVIRIVTLLENGWFDAIAPYHKSAVGVYSDLGRRPAEEGKDNRNKNIAIFYASHKVLNSILPQHRAEWRELLTSVGLDPDDKQENKHTATGLGNLAGKSVVANRENDGMNQLGNEGGKKYHRKPYEDYTGYKPVNTPDKLRNPSRWQPGARTTGGGIFTGQRFVTPQMARTKPYSYDDPTRYRVKPPEASDHHNREAYKRQADEVLAESAGLTDKKKMTAEFFDDKLLFLGAGFPDISQGDDSLDAFVQTAFSIHVASFDTLIAIWDSKVKYDAVRPFTAIRYLYGDKPVSAWGGPGKGTVKDMPGNEWQGYLQAADHAEYPSGSASLCAAAAGVGKRYTGSEKIDLTHTFKKGSSRVEPGLTPTKDTALSWDSWNDYVQDCGRSRVWAGVHFSASLAPAQQVGGKVADKAYEFIQRHVKGDSDRTGR